MTDTHSNIRTLPLEARPGELLAPWVYTNAEVFELEYEQFFLRRWQLIGHVSEVTAAGDFMTADIGRDNVIVVRGKDDVLRAFLNVCRHRGSRILEGSGNCPGVIRCPYHGWTYQLDGGLMAVPQQDDFREFDRGQYGLHEIQLEVFYGLVFIRVKGDGPSVAEQFSYMGDYFAKYDVENYETCAPATTQVWDVNWKVAWDNYLENYHIPIGHPGLFRLIKENGEGGELSSGVGFGVFVIRDKPSKVAVERQYQEQFHHGNARLPADIRGRWVQFGMSGNLGIDLYPEMLDIFQLVPLGHEKTLVRALFFGHRQPTPEELELRRLNVLINDPVNDEDRQLCERVQKGLRTSGYQPGPISSQESGVLRFHNLVRKLVPVTALPKAPPPGQIAAENAKLSA